MKILSLSATRQLLASDLSAFPSHWSKMDVDGMSSDLQIIYRNRNTLPFGFRNFIEENDLTQVDLDPTAVVNTFASPDEVLIIRLIVTKRAIWKHWPEVDLEAQIMGVIARSVKRNLGWVKRPSKGGVMFVYEDIHKTDRKIYLPHPDSQLHTNGKDSVLTSWTEIQSDTNGKEWNRCVTGTHAIAKAWSVEHPDLHVISLSNFVKHKVKEDFSASLRIFETKAANVNSYRYDCTMGEIGALQYLHAMGAIIKKQAQQVDLRLDEYETFGQRIRAEYNFLKQDTSGALTSTKHYGNDESGNDDESGEDTDSDESSDGSEPAQCTITPAKNTMAPSPLHAYVVQSSIITEADAIYAYLKTTRYQILRLYKPNKTDGPFGVVKATRMDEVTTTLRLQKVAGVVDVLTVHGVRPNRYLLVTHYAGGGLLWFCQIQLDYRLFPSPLEVACDIIAVVQRIHEEGFAHLDIKPENICVPLQRRPNGPHAILVDFGSSLPLTGGDKFPKTFGTVG